MTRQRLTVVDLARADAAPDLARDVSQGLSATPKTLPPVHFYDERGSRLFEEITRAPEYYITRTELQILEGHAAEIADLAPGPVTLVELGSGSSEKTRAVIQALLARRGELRYAAIDVSRSALLEAAPGLLRDFPGLSVTAVVADYRDGLSWLSSVAAAGEGLERKLVLYLGSSLGNCAPPEALRLLGAVADSLGEGDRLVLGADLPKPARVLEPAYNDAAGVTARFNLNVLRRINDELGGRFDPAAFRHLAFYNARAQRVEMHLESRSEQDVDVQALDESFHFSRGETIHTEDSHKYDVDQLQSLAAAAGLRRRALWLDEKRWFSVCALERA